MNFSQQFLDYCDNTIWKDDINREILENLSQKAFNDMKQNKTKSKKLYRIAGQSGSGKTTQVLYAVNEVLKEDIELVSYIPDYLKENYNFLSKEESIKIILISFINSIINIFSCGKHG